MSCNGSAEHFQPSATSILGQQCVTAAELAAVRQQLQGLQTHADGPLEEASDDGMPANIGHFQLRQMIGSGSSGSVYLADDSRLSRRVALKVCHLGQYATSELRSRFMREAQAAARLAHPNVVCLHEYGEDRGLLYLVYEMCQGPTLEEWIVSQEQPIPIRIAAGIVRELARGLAHAHVRGLVHRDVKPNNVMLTPNCDDQSWLPYTPRITDFGLAHDLTLGSGNSQSARLVGSLDTMSPEQARGDVQSITPAADQYSLGIILYRLLTGTVPFAGDDVLTTLQRICKEQPRSPRRLRPEVSADLAAIVLTCLNKDPSARYTSCKELARDLDRFLAGQPVAARPLRIHQRGWRLMRAAPLVSTLVLMLVLGSLGSAITFSLMAGSLQQQQRALRQTVGQLLSSEARAVRAQQQTVAALERVTRQQRVAEAQQRVAEMQKRKAVGQAYRADVHRAFEAWNKRQLLATAEMIDSIDADIYGTLDACYALRLLAAQSRLQIQHLDEQPAPATEVKAIAGTPWVVGSSHSGQLSFYNLHTGCVEQQLTPVPNCQIDGLDVSRDGRQIAISFNAPSLDAPYCKVYELTPGERGGWLGECQATLASTTTGESLSFSPCGNYLAVGQRYEPVRIHELSTGKLVAQIDCTTRNRSLDFSPDGQWCLLAGDDHHLVLADAASGAISQRLPSTSSVQYTRWSRCGSWLAYTTYRDPTVHLIFADDHRHRVDLVQPHGAIESIAFSDDGCWIAAGTSGGGVAAWSLAQLLPADIPSQSPPAKLPSAFDAIVHAGEVSSLCVVDEQWIVSASDSGSVVCNPLPSRASESLGKQVTVAAVSDSAAAPGMVLGYADGSVTVAHCEADQACQLIAARNVQVSAIYCHPDGSQATIGWHDGQIDQVDLRTQRVTPVGYPPPMDSLDDRKISSLCWDPQGTALLQCGSDARVRLWSASDLARPLWERKLRSHAYVACFCGEEQVAVGGMFEEILILDRASGEIDARILGASRTRCLMYDPVHRCLVSGHADGRVRIHTGANWQYTQTLNGEGGEINCLTGSPQWDNYISGDASGNIRLWSATHRELVGNLITLPDGQAVAHMAIDAQLDTLKVIHTDPLADSSATGTLAYLELKAADIAHSQEAK